MEAFDAPGALAINRARLAHLASLALPLAGKRVLDVGCGVGHLAQFFVERGCDVVCVDGRAENVAALRQRYPHLTAHVLDVEAEPLARLGVFPVVFSYGLLYHLENPVAGLRNMASACSEILLLETLICDQTEPVMRLVDESKTANQALRGFGSRPSPSFVVAVLSQVGFPFVYAPSQPPDHQDFRFRWLDSLDVERDGHPLRCIFVASRRRLETLHLVSLLDG
jgi:SAM-dependent methyltransferase